MPTPLQLAAYQLGIRFVHCRELNRRAITGRTYGPWDFGIGSDDVALARHSIRELNNAFVRFAEASVLQKGTREACIALIRECQRLWKKFCRVPLYDLHEDSTAQDEVSNNLQRLRDRLTEIAGNVGTDGTHFLTWFELGVQLSDGDWSPPSPRRIKKRIKLRNRELEVESENLEGWVWCWSNPDEVRQLLTETGASECELFPYVEKTAMTVSLLPYNQADYWPWFRIEAGMQAMLTATREVENPTPLPPAADLVPPAPANLPLNNEPPAEGVWKPFYLGLQLDYGQQRVKREGHEPISVSALPWGLLRAIGDGNASYASEDELRKVWRRCGLKDPSSRKIILAAVNDLKKKVLIPLGVTIENKRNVGWKLKLVVNGLPGS